MSTAARRLGTAATWAVLGFVLAVLLAAAAPLALGDRSYVVKSGSMAPEIETGDVLVVEPVPADSVEVGEIVTFDNPDAGGQLTSHRVRAIEATDEGLRFTTQGDSNTADERWSIAAAGTVGRALYRVPKLGFAVNVIQSPAGKLGLIVLPALLLAISLLSRIWSRPESEGPDGAAA
jgi:signal peptidase I